MSIIKNIIFDFGIVLYDIDQEATHRALTALGITDASKIFTIQKQNQLCDLFETGKINDIEFFNGLKELASPHVSIKQIRIAWQAMLTGLPLNKFLLLQELRKQYTLMVLSNTNHSHIDAINASLLKTYHLSSIHDLFDDTYLSFEVGLRKPDPAIFHHLIEHAYINPSETLFIDDLEANVDAAQSIGIDALLYKKGDDLRNMLNKALRTALQ